MDSCVDLSWALDFPVNVLQSSFCNCNSAQVQLANWLVQLL